MFRLLGSSSRRIHSLAQTYPLQRTANNASRHLCPIRHCHRRILLLHCPSSQICPFRWKICPLHGTAHPCLRPHGHRLGPNSTQRGRDQDEERRVNSLLNSILHVCSAILNGIRSQGLLEIHRQATCRVLAGAIRSGNWTAVLAERWGECGPWQVCVVGVPPYCDEVCPQFAMGWMGSAQGTV